MLVYESKAKAKINGEDARATNTTFLSSLSNYKRVKKTFSLSNRKP